MKTITIIGCGWLGLPLGVALQQDGYTVRGTTTTASKLAHLQLSGIDPYLARLTAAGLEAAESTLLLGSDIVIITIPPGRSDTDRALRYPGQLQLLLKQIAVRAPVPRVVYTSSTSVYGEPVGVVTEASVTDPQTPSARAVVAAEQALQATIPEWLIVRLAGLYGPDRHPGRWLAGKTDLSGGNAPVNLVHQQDVISAIRTLLAADHWGNIYNICSELHPLKRHYYPLMCQRLGLALPVYRKDTAPGGKIVQNDKLKRDTGFAYQYPDPQVV